MVGVHMLTWLVYIEDFNRKEIAEYNIFNHYYFHQDCIKYARKYKDDKEKFLEEIHRSLMYFFWSKCEAEVVITTLIQGGAHQNSFHDRKVSIYDQVMLHWDVFSEWIWSHRKELARRTKKVSEDGAHA